LHRVYGMIEMTLPRRHRTDWARRRGEIPYPCGYCMNYLQGLKEKCDEHNVIQEFGEDGEIPLTCMAGQHKPTDYGDCRHIMLKALPNQYARWFPSEIFSFFTKEYTMEMLTDIRCQPYLTKSMIIGRAHKGYHTREQRLQEFIDEGLVDVGYNINSEEIYHLTDYGQRIADAVSDMLDNYILIKHHGELMSYDEVRLVFEYIYSHRDCDFKSIYDHFNTTPTVFDDATGDRIADMTDALGHVVDSLLDAEYIDCVYDGDFIIRYDVTQKGIDRWRAMYRKE